MIFLTVGTQFPFDRLVRAVDDAIETGVFEEEVFAQVGLSNYQPQNMRYVETLDKETFDSHFQKASFIIGHSGMGTITMALDYNKPLLVMPRLKKHGEIVNDHQVTIAKKFEELNHILVAYNEKDFIQKLEKLKFFVPRHRENQAKEVANRIAEFLNELQKAKY